MSQSGSQLGQKRRHESKSKRAITKGAEAGQPPFRGTPSTPNICHHLGHSWWALEVARATVPLCQRPEMPALRLGGCKNRENGAGGGGGWGVFGRDESEG